MRHGYQKLLKSPPLTELPGSAPALMQTHSVSHIMRQSGTKLKANHVLTIVWCLQCMMWLKTYQAIISFGRRATSNSGTHPQVCGQCTTVLLRWWLLDCGP